MVVTALLAQLTLVLSQAEDSSEELLTYITQATYHTAKFLRKTSYGNVTKQCQPLLDDHNDFSDYTDDSICSTRLPAFHAINNLPRSVRARQGWRQTAVATFCTISFLCSMVQLLLGILIGIFTVGRTPRSFVRFLFWGDHLLRTNISSFALSVMTLAAASVFYWGAWGRWRASFRWVSVHVLRVGAWVGEAIGCRVHVQLQELSSCPSFVLSADCLSLIEACVHVPGTSSFPRVIWP